MNGGAITNGGAATGVGPAANSGIDAGGGGAAAAGAGCFYGVGVGPGDPELLTIRAQRLVQRLPALCFTQLDNGAPSYALSVLGGLLDAAAPPELLAITIPADDAPVNPQVWREAAVRIAARLRNGQDVGFITEGDPLFYSEFAHLLECVRAEAPEAAIEVVPGVASVMAAAASSGVPLVTHGQQLSILSSVYGIDHLMEYIANYDAVVLMEVSWRLIQDLASRERLGLTGKVIYVRQASTARERVVEDISKLTQADLDYFSLLIIQRQSRDTG